MPGSRRAALRRGAAGSPRHSARPPGGAVAQRWGGAGRCGAALCPVPADPGRRAVTGGGGFSSRLFAISLLIYLFARPAARFSSLLRFPRSEAPRAAPLPAPPPASAAARRGGGGRGRRRGAGGDWRRLGGSARPLAMPMPARPCGRYSTGMARPGGMAGVPVGALLPLLVGVCGAVTGSRVYPANEGEARPPRGKVRCRRRSLCPAAPRAARSRRCRGPGPDRCAGPSAVPRPPRLSPFSVGPGQPSRAALPERRRAGAWEADAVRDGAGAGPPVGAGGPAALRRASEAPLVRRPELRSLPAPPEWPCPAPLRVTSLGAPLRAPRGAAREPRAERSAARSPRVRPERNALCFASPQ